VSPRDNTRPVLHHLLLAHHPPGQANRCVLLPVAGRHVALCARCLGFYPLLLVTLTAQALLDPPRLGALDWWVVLGGAFPGLLDWGAGVLDPRGGSNRRRVGTGMVIGVAAGRAIWLQWNDPLAEPFWVLAALVLAVALIVLWIRRIRPPEGL